MTSSPPEGAHYVGSGPAPATPQPRRRRAVAAALAVAAAAGLAGALAALADLAWWLELFAHFRPQYALALAASGAVLLASGARAAGVAALLLAAVNALPLLHYYHPRPLPAPPGPQLRAVLANVWFRNTEHGRLLAWLRDTRPDVAVLLEVTPQWRASLATLRDVLPYQAHSAGVFVASRRPLGALRAVAFEGGEEGALAFTTELGAERVTVIGAHASWPLGPAVSAQRNAQLETLAALARGSAPGPVLLLGDLNLTAFTPRFARLLDRGGLADCAAGRGFEPSWPARFPPLALRIDHCLHGPGLRPLTLRNGPQIGSDHRPLEVVLVPAAPGAAGGEGFRRASARRTSRP
jgi:endonuclease/exonuclease/phosphatase (EEP) superfamily protein YafD